MELLAQREAQQKIQDDPVDWVRSSLGVRPWDKQVEILESVFANRRTAVKSAHGVGKTFITAVACLAFHYAYPDSVVITTAPVARQVEKSMWGYIRHFHRRASLPGKCLQLELRDEDDPLHYMVGFTATSSEQFQGFHAPHILVAVDEASGISPDIAVAIEGIMSSGESRLILIGNPTQQSGYFFDAFNSQRDLYHTVTLSARETPEYKEPGSYPYLPSREWVDERARVWGEDSPLFRIRVLGEFAHDETNGVIPLSWVEAANRRWEQLAGTDGFIPFTHMDALGVDVGLSHDESVLAPR